MFLEKGERITAISRGSFQANANWVLGDTDGLVSAGFWGRLVIAAQPPAMKTEGQFPAKILAVPRQAQLYSNESEACCALDILDLFPVRTPSGTKEEQTANKTDEICCQRMIAF